MDSQIYTFVLDADGQVNMMFNPAKYKAKESLELVGFEFQGITITLYSVGLNMGKTNGRATRLAQYLVDPFLIHRIEVSGDLLVRIHVDEPYSIESLKGSRKDHVEHMLDEALGFCIMKEAGDMPETMKRWLEVKVQDGHGDLVARGVKAYGQYAPSRA